jgi:hypothetical protein
MFEWMSMPWQNVTTNSNKNIIENMYRISFEHKTILNQNKTQE